MDDFHNLVGRTNFPLNQLEGFYNLDDDLLKLIF